MNWKHERTKQSDDWLRGFGGNLGKIIMGIGGLHWDWKKMIIWTWNVVASNYERWIRTEKLLDDSKKDGGSTVKIGVTGREEPNLGHEQGV